MFIKNWILTSTAIASLAVGAAAVEHQPQEPGLLLTSRALLDQTLYARDGSEIGSLSQVLIDAESGLVRFVAVDLSARTVAVPWRHVDVSDDGRLELRVPVGELLSSPDLDRERLDESTSRGLPLSKRALTTVSGIIEIASVEPISLYEDGETLAATLVATDELRVRVVLAPESYLDEAGLSPERGQQVEIEGVQVVLEGKPTIIAYEVRTAGGEIRLRHKEDGTPLWETGT